MDIALLLLLLLTLWLILRMRSQAQRIMLLGQQLSGLQIEQHMQTLTEGYMRAIHEADPQRQAQIWPTLASTERALASQAQRLATGMGQHDSSRTRIGRWSFDVPYIERWLPAATRDFRALLRIHAEGLQRMESASDLPPKDRAYQLMAELLLLQHSCHWFCKSRNTADARLVLRHQVTHEKVLQSIHPLTLRAYQQWLAT